MYRNIESAQPTQEKEKTEHKEIATDFANAMMEKFDPMQCNEMLSQMIAALEALKEFEY